MTSDESSYSDSFESLSHLVFGGIMGFVAVWIMGLLLNYGLAGKGFQILVVITCILVIIELFVRARWWSVGMFVGLVLGSFYYKPSFELWELLVFALVAVVYLYIKRG